MMKAAIKKYELNFITPGQTSRGTLYSKPSWFFILTQNGFTGIGECSVIPGLNPEYQEGYEKKLTEVVDQINAGSTPAPGQLEGFPSVQFGLEAALLNLEQKHKGMLFPSAFTRGEAGIPINGLIWMGNKQQMQERIREKLDLGFKVLKLKVGALNFDEEAALLKNLRKQFSPDTLEIRLDANGAFSPHDALQKLEVLAGFHIHSIEQPIQANQWEQMAHICTSSPLPVALDEELIGVSKTETKEQLLSQIKPQFIILKPSLLGGLEHSNKWIELAEKRNIGWWATSALESNVGLNAIAQWTFTKNPKTVQGLGTGQVFSNNIASPLTLNGPELFYKPVKQWGNISDI